MSLLFLCSKGYTISFKGSWTYHTVYDCWMVLMSRPFSFTTDSTCPFRVWSSLSLPCIISKHIVRFISSSSRNMAIHRKHHVWGCVQVAVEDLFLHTLQFQLSVLPLRPSDSVRCSSSSRETAWRPVAADHGVSSVHVPTIEPHDTGPAPSNAFDWSEAPISIHSD